MSRMSRLGTQSRSSLWRRPWRLRPGRRGGGAGITHGGGESRASRLRDLVDNGTCIGDAMKSRVGHQQAPQVVTLLASLQRSNWVFAAALLSKEIESLRFCVVHEPLSRAGTPTEDPDTDVSRIRLGLRRADDIRRRAVRLPSTATSSPSSMPSAGARS